MEKIFKRYNYKLAVFVIIGICCIYAGFYFMLYSKVFKDQFKANLEEKNIFVKKVIEESIEFQLYSSLQAFLTFHNKELFHIIKTHDKEKILHNKMLKRFWEQFQKRYGKDASIDFHFFDTNSLSQLINNAKKTKSVQNSYELINGKLYFKVAHPIFNKDEVGAVIEIGVSQVWIQNYIQKIFPEQITPLIFTKGLPTSYNDQKKVVFLEYSALLDVNNSVSNIMPNKLSAKNGIQTIDFDGERYYYQTDKTYDIKGIDEEVISRVILVFNGQKYCQCINENILKYTFISFLITLGVVFFFIFIVKYLLKKMKKGKDTFSDLKERFHLAIKSTQDGLWDWDIRNDSLYLSPHWKKMLGFSDDEIEDSFQSWENLIHKEDKEEFLESLKRHCNKESQYFENEHRLQNKKGEYIWVLARGKAVFDKNNKAQRVVGFNTNINEKKQNLNFLDTVISIFEMILTSNNIHNKVELILQKMIQTTKADRVYVFKNKMINYSLACCLKFEYVRDGIKSQKDNPDLQKLLYTQFGGERWLKFFNRDQYMEALVKDLSGEEKLFLEKLNVKSILVIPLFYKNQLWGFIGFDNCISEKLWTKRDKSILKIMAQAFIATLLKDEYSTELEKKVQLHLHQIREKEKVMIQHNKLASMTEMIGNIAHQWRQPLNTIGALSLKGETLLEMDTQIQKKKLQEIFQKVDNNLLFMSKVIDDFRNFFKPTSEKEYFDVVDSIKYIMNIVESSFKKSNIELHLVFLDSCEIYGYKNEFEQVILNLLNNSKDALDSVNGERSVDIGVLKEENKTLITIVDNGGGIDEEILDKVFDPYFTTKFQDQGTGLGLYMSKLIIEEHMGGILNIHNTNNGVSCNITFQNNNNL